MQAEHLFGREPKNGLILSAGNELIIVGGEAFLPSAGWSGQDPRITIETPSSYSIGIKVTDYRFFFNSIQYVNGGVKVSLMGRVGYANVGDMYNMIRLDPGTNEEHLLNALNRRLDERLGAS